MNRTQLKVNGMTCEACVSAVREALALPGVRPIVDVSLETGIVDVAHGDGVTVERIVDAIEGTGYEVREAHAMTAPSLRRFTPKARGSAGPVIKRSCHIQIVLSDKSE